MDEKLLNHLIQDMVMRDVASSALVCEYPEYSVDIVRFALLLLASFRHG
jgi:hypothetical protein